MAHETSVDLIKAGISIKSITNLFNRFNLNFKSEIKYNDDLFLLGLGNPYFYNLYCKYVNPELIYIIEDKGSQFLYEGRNDIIKDHIKFINLNNLNNFKNEIFWPMKFSKIIANPPYSYNLHLQIIEKVIKDNLKDDGEFINLSPLRWLQDPLAKDKKNSDYIKFEKSVSKHITNIDIINSNESNKLFGISWGDLGIYNFILKNGNYDYELLSKNLIVEKIKNFALIDNVNNYATKEGPNQNYVGCFGIINSHYGDMTSFVSENEKLWNLPRYTNTSKMISFENNDEMRNFFKSNLTNTLRYYAISVKKNQRQPWQLIPWLGNIVNPRTKLLGYKSEWTDNDLAEIFKFNDKDKEEIKEVCKKEIIK